MMGLISSNSNHFPAFRGGSRIAFWHLFKSHHSLLYQYIAEQCEDKESVKHILKFAFVEAWEHRDFFEDENQLVIFLYFAAADSVYQQIVSDLEDAQRLLPADYSGGDRTRPCQAVATALLAKVWLYRGQWALAAAATGQVIGDGRFRLEPDMGKVFLDGSQEAIWQLRPVYSQTQPDGSSVRVATAEGSLFQPKRDSTAPVYVLQDSLLRSYEAGDLRVAAWTRKLVLRGRSFVYPAKYKQTVWTDVGPEYETVVRLAEMYLIRAEARARMGDVVGAAADLDIVRQRAGLGPVQSTGDMVGAVLRERRHELFSEWGHRWMDLRRTGLVGVALG